MQFNEMSGGFLLVGGLLTGISFLFLKFPPKQINGLYGYRSRRSMRHQEAWDFSQKLSGKYLLRLSLLMLVLGVAFLFVDVAALPDWLPMAAMLSYIIVGFGILLFKVERRLKKLFPQKPSKAKKH